MSKNIKQIYDANPITSNAPTDLMYFGQSPYGIGDDAAMLYSDFAIQNGSYIEVTGTTQALIANKSYFATNVATTTFSLPTTNCPRGSYIEIAGNQAQFVVSQSAGQNIIHGTVQSTPGASGNISSDALNTYSALKLLCIADNLTFMVVYSQGNFTAV